MPEVEWYKIFTHNLQYLEAEVTMTSDTNIVYVKAFDIYHEAVHKLWNSLHPVGWVMKLIPFSPVTRKDNPIEPSHYGGRDNPFEVIKVLEEWLTVEEFIGAMKFQIFKYTARANKKGNASQDHAKSAWYGQYLTDYLKRKNRET